MLKSFTSLDISAWSTSPWDTLAAYDNALCHWGREWTSATPLSSPPSLSLVKCELDDRDDEPDGVDGFHYEDEDTEQDARSWYTDDDNTPSLPRHIRFQLQPEHSYLGLRRVPTPTPFIETVTYPTRWGCGRRCCEVLRRVWRRVRRGFEGRRGGGMLARKGQVEMWV